VRRATKGFTIRATDGFSLRATNAFTLVELAIASAVLAIILSIGFGVVVREHRMTRATVAIGVAEVHAQDMLNRLAREIADAEGELPKALVATTIGAGDTGSLDVDTTLGFPDQGILLVERGTGSTERIAYDALGAGGASFRGLARGVQCTNAHSHPPGASVLWGSLAQVVPLSGSPPPSDYDGRALEPEGPSFFVGDGTGFSYRLPTDPDGGSDVIQGDSIRWGAVAGGAPTLTGWAALVFVPISLVSEAELHVDLNKDGDETDTFEVGQIRARAWDTANPAAPASDIGLGPAVILQELCSSGRDLDGDGFDDPIFLWNPAEGRLHVRLFVLGRSKGEVPAVRKVETTIFLRNVAKT
jgi:prepilin-type N-terminal cleavage/methylation domain-containing protein